MPSRLLHDHREDVLPANLGTGFIYPPQYFHRRLKEEFLRTLRTQQSFLYIRIPTRHFDLFGFEQQDSEAVLAWKIAVLTLLTQSDFLDVKGYLKDQSGIGLICLDTDHLLLEQLKKSIRRNLREADLLQTLRLKPKRPLFEAYLCTGEPETKHLTLQEIYTRFNHSSEGFFSLQTMMYTDIEHNPWNNRLVHFIKRSIDILASICGLIFLSPWLLLLSLLVKFSDPKGPMIFSQIRVGRNGKTFTMYKFRSMYVDAEERLEKLRHLNETTGPIFKMKNDPRIYPIGRFLRKYSLDELPQLINILLGDMSIVGPRPPIPDEVSKYEAWHRMRLSVKPGLTCHWQVSGRSKLGFNDQVRLDNKYIRHGDIATDMSLIRKTFRVVFKGDGAY